MPSNRLQVRPLALVLTADADIDRRILQQNDILTNQGWDLYLYSPQLDPSASNGGNRNSSTSNLPHENGSAIFEAVYSLFLKFVGSTGFAKNVKEFLWKVLSISPAFLAKFYSLGFLGLLGLRPPSIIIAHDLPMLPLGAQLARHYSCALIFDSHEYYPGQVMSRLESRAWRKIEAKYVKDVSALITVNDSIAGIFQSLYQLKKICVVQNAVDALRGAEYAHVELREKLDLPLSEKIVLFQGALSPGRNLQSLVHSLRFVKTKNIKLVFLGDGLESASLRELAKSLGVGSLVLFHPKVPQDLLLNYTAGADLGVIPYIDNCINNRFCTPNKLYEFIAAGLPVLGTNLPEVEKILRKYEIGRTVDMLLPESIAESIDAIFSDEEHFSSMRRNVKVASASINWQIEGLKWMEVISSVHKPKQMTD